MTPQQLNTDHSVLAAAEPSTPASAVMPATAPASDPVSQQSATTASAAAPPLPAAVSSSDVRAAPSQVLASSDSTVDDLSFPPLPRPDTRPRRLQHPAAAPPPLPAPRRKRPGSPVLSLDSIGSSRHLDGSVVAAPGAARPPAGHFATPSTPFPGRASVPSSAAALRAPVLASAAAPVAAATPAVRKWGDDEDAFPSGDALPPPTTQSTCPPMPSLTEGDRSSEETEREETLQSNETLPEHDVSRTGQRGVEATAAAAVPRAADLEAPRPPPEGGAEDGSSPRHGLDKPPEALVPTPGAPASISRSTRGGGQEGAESVVVDPSQGEGDGSTSPPQSLSIVEGSPASGSNTLTTAPKPPEPSVTAKQPMPAISSSQPAAAEAPTIRESTAASKGRGSARGGGRLEGTAAAEAPTVRESTAAGKGRGSARGGGRGRGRGSRGEPIVPSAAAVEAQQKTSASYVVTRKQPGPPGGYSEETLLHIPDRPSGWEPRTFTFRRAGRARSFPCYERTWRVPAELHAAFHACKELTEQQLDDLLEGSEWLAPWYSRNDRLLAVHDIIACYFPIGAIWVPIYAVSDSIVTKLAGYAGQRGAFALSHLADYAFFAEYEGLLQCFSTKDGRDSFVGNKPSAYHYAFRSVGNPAGEWCVIDGAQARDGGGQNINDGRDVYPPNLSASVVAWREDKQGLPRVLISVHDKQGIPPRSNKDPGDAVLVKSEGRIRYTDSFWDAYDKRRRAEPAESVAASYAFVASAGQSEGPSCGDEESSEGLVCFVCSVSVPPECAVLCHHHGFAICNNRRQRGLPSCATRYFQSATREGIRLPPTSRHGAHHVCSDDGVVDPFRLYIAVRNDRPRIISYKELPLFVSRDLPAPAPVMSAGIVNDWLTGSEVVGDGAEDEAPGAVFAATVYRRRRNLPRSLPAPLLAFSDRFYHWTHFKRLLAGLAQSAIKEAENNSRGDVAIRWDSLGSSTAAYFYYNTATSEDLTTRDIVELSYGAEDSADRWSSRAKVYTLLGASAVGVIVEDTVKESQRAITSGYTVQKIPLMVPIDRQQTSLFRSGTDEYCYGFKLRNLLMGERVDVATSSAPEDARAALSQLSLVAGPAHAVERQDLQERLRASIKHLFDDDLRIPGLGRFNQMQQVAFAVSTYSTLNIVQGPPGTGKTDVAAGLAWLSHTHRRAVDPHGQSPILICAPSNEAANQVARKVFKTGLKVLRFFAKSYQVPADFPEEMRISAHVDEETSKLLCELDTFEAALQAGGVSLTKEDRSLRDKYVGTALANVQIVVCTCSAAADSFFADTYFPDVIIDEAGKCTEPDIFIPLQLGCERLTLVGDHKQLSPRDDVRSPMANNSGLGVSLFERLMLGGHVPSVMLDTQYRMHPAISVFPSFEFYGDGQGGRLLFDGVKHDARSRADVSFPWPNAQHPTYFVQTKGPDRQPLGSTSHCNDNEAKAAVRIVCRLLEASAKPADIGVITPYAAQTALILRLLSEFPDASGVEVANVDTYQGRDKEFVILSCVRSNARNEPGFFKSPNRLNVALTRARCGLIILGDLENFKVRCPQWRALARSYMNRGLLFKGDPLAPQPATVSLAQEHVTAEEELALAAHQHTADACAPVLAAVCDAVPFAPSFDAPPAEATEKQPNASSRTKEQVLVASLCDRIHELAGMLSQEDDIYSTSHALHAVLSCERPAPPPSAPDSERHCDPCITSYIASAAARGAFSTRVDASQRWTTPMLVGAATPVAESTSYIPVMRTKWWSQFRLLAALWRTRSVGWLDNRQVVLMWRYVHSGQYDKLVALVAANRYEHGRLPGPSDSTLPRHVMRPPAVSGRSLGLLWREVDFSGREARGLVTLLKDEELTAFIAESSNRFQLGASTVVRVPHAARERFRSRLTPSVYVVVGDTTWAPVLTYILDRTEQGRGLSFSGAVYRMVRQVRCKYGAMWALGLMATIADFAQQRANFESVLSWYRLWIPVVLKRCPEAIVLLPFCSPGGHSEGCALAGLSGAGIDIAKDLSDATGWFHHLRLLTYPQQPVRITISQGDALSWEVRARAVAEHPRGSDHLATISTASCGPHSLLRNLQPPSAASSTASGAHDLLEDIAMNEAELRRSGVNWMSETTGVGRDTLSLPEGVGSCAIMELDAGIRAHGRHLIFYPKRWPLFLDGALQQGSKWLERHSCTGSDKPILPRQPHGATTDCGCEGNLCACYNNGTFKYSVAETGRMMEVDPRHVTSMSRMTKLLPPPLGTLLALECAMHAVNIRFGMPSVSFDEGSRDSNLAAWVASALERLASDDDFFDSLVVRSSRNHVRVVWLVCCPSGAPVSSIVLCTSDFSIPCVSLTADSEGGSLVSRVAEAAYQQLGLEVQATRLRFVRDVSYCGVNGLVFATSSMGLSMRTRLAANSQDMGTVLLGSWFSAEPSRDGDAKPSLALVKTSLYVDALVASLPRGPAAPFQVPAVSQSVPAPAANISILLSACSLMPEVRVDVEGSGVNLSAHSCVLNTWIGEPTESSRALIKRLFRISVLPVPRPAYDAAQRVPLPSTDHVNNHRVAVVKLAGVPPLSVNTAASFAGFVDSPPLADLKLPVAAQRRELYISLRARHMVSPLAHGPPSTFGLGGTQHPESGVSTVSRVGGFGLQPIDRCLAAVVVVTAAGHVLVHATSCRQLGVPARVHGKSKEVDAAARDLTEIVIDALQSRLLDVLGRSALYDIIAARTATAVRESTSQNARWLVHSRDWRGDRSSTSVPPVAYDCSVWRVLLPADVETPFPTVHDINAPSLPPFIPGSVCWVRFADLLSHFRMTGRVPLAGGVEALCSSLEAATLSPVAQELQATANWAFAFTPAHELMREVKKLGYRAAQEIELRALLRRADMTLARQTRYESVRISRSCAPMVELYFSEPFFSALLRGQKTVELRVNEGSAATLRCHSVARCRPTASGVCVHRDITSIRHYPSFAHAILSGDFKSRCVGGPADLHTRSALEIERYFYALNCRRARDNGERATIAAKWASGIGRPGRVVCFYLAPLPSHVAPPGARFLVRDLSDVPRRVDVRPAWRRFARCSSRLWHVFPPAVRLPGGDAPRARLVSSLRERWRRLVHVSTMRRLSHYAQHVWPCILSTSRASVQWRRLLDAIISSRRSVTLAAVAVGADGLCRVRTEAAYVVFWCSSEPLVCCIDCDDASTPGLVGGPLAVRDADWMPSSSVCDSVVRTVSRVVTLPDEWRAALELAVSSRAACRDVTQYSSDGVAQRDLSLWAVAVPAQPMPVPVDPSLRCVWRPARAFLDLLSAHDDLLPVAGVVSSLLTHEVPEFAYAVAPQAAAAAPAVRDDSLPSPALPQSAAAPSQALAATNSDPAVG